MKNRTCPECGAEFAPTYNNQVCCSAECKRKRAKRLEREAKIKRRGLDKLEREAAAAAHARQVVRARRDLEYAACHVPESITFERGFIIERRGTGFYGGRVGVQSSSWRRENHHSPTPLSNSPLQLQLKTPTQNSNS